METPEIGQREYVERLLLALGFLRDGLKSEDSDESEDVRLAYEVLGRTMDMLKLLDANTRGAVCAFCEARFHHDLPAPMDAVREHILACDKHPLGVELKRLGAERAALLRLCYREVVTSEERFFAIVVDTVDREKRKHDTREAVEGAILSLAMEVQT